MRRVSLLLFLKLRVSASERLRRLVAVVQLQWRISSYDTTPTGRQIGRDVANAGRLYAIDSALSNTISGYRARLAAGPTKTNKPPPPPTPRPAGPLNDRSFCSAIVLARPDTDIYWHFCSLKPNSLIYTIICINE